MIPRYLFIAGCLIAGLSAFAATSLPNWQSNEVTGDPLFFQQDRGEPFPKANLLRVPSRAPTITSASGETTYTSGIDYVWQVGTREIRLVAGSRIPFKTWNELHPPPNSPNAYNGYIGGQSWLLYSQGRFFHDLQCAASYTTTDAWSPTKSPRAPDVQLGGLRARLSAKSSIRVVVLGDSISTGLNASVTGNAPPMQEGYAELVAQALRNRFETTVTLRNLSVSGKSTPWAVEQMPAVLAESPSLFICAFGMNDASAKRTSDEFTAHIRKMLELLASQCPDCETILVTPMLANPEWTGATPALYPEYARALKKLIGPKVAVADITTIWSELLEHKSTLDLTGNGLNHPNDFGHRVYASVVLDTIDRWVQQALHNNPISSQ